MKTLVILSLILNACSSSTLAVKRIDPNTEKSLSGYWNDTDSKLVSDELIGQVLEANWLSDFTKTNGKKPLLVIGRVSNKTSEHLKTITFVKDIERNLINSGRVRFVAGMQERKDLRTEKIDQQKNADFDKAKELGKEEAADFMLMGVISSISDQVDGKKVIFYQVDMELINIETNEKVWLGNKKIKKVINRDAYKLAP